MSPPLSEMGLAAQQIVQSYGWPVFPCDHRLDGPGEKRCKKPLVKGGFLAASRDPYQIDEWWRQWPDALISVPAGRETGVFILDPDVDAEKHLDGLVDLKRLIATHGPLPDTVQAITPRGGRHYYFEWLEGLGNGQGALPPSINCRGQGGYVCVPPSRRADGAAYRWEKPLGPFRPAPLPDWLLSIIGTKPKPQFSEAFSQRRNGGGNRSSAYAEAALRYECEEVARQSEGARNNRLNRAAFSLGQLVGAGELDETTAVYRLLEAAERCGLLAADGEPQTRATIASGIEAGKREPRKERPGADATSEKWGARDAGSGEQPAGAIPQLRVIDPVDWQGVPVPERESIVKDFIPANTTTLLTAGGGTGKSILAQQLAVARAAKRNWLSLPTRPGRTLVLSAEDDAEEMHRRLDAIRIHYGVSFADLGSVRLVDLVGEDAVLGALAKNGIVQATPLMDAVTRHVEDFKPDLVIVDALADAFAGDENNRGQARQFVSLLKRPARHYRCAFVCLAHPSLTGITSGTGSSGSTAWANSMRSRILFKPVEAPDGGTPDPDLRTLTVNKSNYGPTGLSLTLKWSGGAFAVQGGSGSLDRQAQENKADATFLDLLRMFNLQGQNVCANPGTTYAPARFAAHPNANGVGKRQFEAAMQRHLAYNRIRIEMFGPPSRLRSRLVVVEGEERDG